MSPASDPHLEEFTFPYKRDQRVAELKAAGWTEAPANGQPLVGGQFRRIDRFGKYCLRLAPIKLPGERQPSTARWSRHRAEIAAQQPRVLELAAEGRSITAIMAATGLSRLAVKKLIGDRTFTCACGKPADHRGSCAIRYRLTPAREEAARRVAERSMSPEGRLAARERARQMQAKLTQAERSARARASHARHTPEERREVTKRSARERLERAAAARMRVQEILAAAAADALCLSTPGLTVVINFALREGATTYERDLVRRLAEAVVRYEMRKGGGL